MGLWSVEFKPESDLTSTNAPAQRSRLGRVSALFSFLSKAHLGELKFLPNIFHVVGDRIDSVRDFLDEMARRQHLQEEME